MENNWQSSPHKLTCLKCHHIKVVLRSIWFLWHSFLITNLTVLWLDLDLQRTWEKTDIGVWILWRVYLDCSWSQFWHGWQYSLILKRGFPVWIQLVFGRYSAFRLGCQLHSITWWRHKSVCCITDVSVEAHTHTYTQTHTHTHTHTYIYIYIYIYTPRREKIANWPENNPSRWLMTLSTYVREINTNRLLFLGLFSDKKFEIMKDSWGC